MDKAHSSILRLAVGSMLELGKTICKMAKAQSTFKRQLKTEKIPKFSSKACLREVNEMEWEKNKSNLRHKAFLIATMKVNLKMA